MILYIAPHNTLGNSTKNGVALFAANVSNRFTVITDGANTSVGKSQWSSLAQLPIIDYGKVQACQVQILEHLETSIVEGIVCATLEGVQACHGLGLPKIMPVYYCVHNSFLPFGIKSGAGADKAWLAASYVYEGVRLAARCAFGKQLLEELFPIACVDVLPVVPTFESVCNQQKNYMLAIARFDDVKRPKLIVEIAVALGKPLVVMTGSSRQAKQWEKILSDTGLEYCVVFGVSGEKKKKILQGARCALVASVVESYGLSVVETAMYCKTVLISEKSDWHRNFKDSEIYKFLGIVTSKKPVSEAVEILRKAYIEDYSLRANKSLLAKIKAEFDESLDTFIKCICKGFPLGKSQIIQEFESKGSIDWKDYQTLQRNIKGLHQILANKKVKISGTVVKEK